MPKKTGVLVSIALASIIALTGCSEESDADRDASPSASSTTSATPSASDIKLVDNIKVEDQGEGQAPKVSFDTPLMVSAVTTRVAKEGTGETVGERDISIVRIIGFLGSDASEQANTFGSDSIPDALNPFDQMASADLVKAFVGQKVGAQIVIANPDPENSETYIIVAEIVDKVSIAERATGSTVTPAEGLPVVTLADNGTPSIALPEGFNAGSDLTVQTLIEGEGPVVQSGQDVTFNYTGWKSSDGTQFDSSWDRGTPFVSAIGVNEVVVGWDEAIVGKKVGSQLLIIVPPSKGYGDVEGHELQNETMIFVVDILATVDTAQSVAAANGTDPAITDETVTQE